MAGPVFYRDDFKNAKTPFPAYYDGKLFIYEWARSWVKVVTFDENKNLKKIEPFLPGQEWFKPIDMKFGPDGAMYVLQYGANYFEHNPDSRLVRSPIQKATGSHELTSPQIKPSVRHHSLFNYQQINHSILIKKMC
jgi:cytochrome c